MRGLARSMKSEFIVLGEGAYGVVLHVKHASRRYHVAVPSRAWNRIKHDHRSREDMVIAVLADMEGPAVKWFVTAPSISWSMLTSEYLSGRHGRFPEDAGARLTMERLRRRIRLICAGCSEEQKIGRAHV